MKPFSDCLSERILICAPPDLAANSLIMHPSLIQITNEIIL